MILELLVVSGAVAAVVRARRKRSAPDPAEASAIPPSDAPTDGRSPIPSPTSGEAKFEAEVAAVDRDLAFSAAASIAAGAGAVIAPPLTLVALPLLAVPLWQLGRLSWDDLQRTGKVSLGGLQSIGGVAAIALGHVGLCAVGTAAFIGGKRIQLATRRRTRDALADAFEGWVEQVRVVRDGVEFEVSLDSVAPGERVLIGAGRPVPCDGTLLDGHVVIDQSRLTGESTLVDRLPGDRLQAATLTVQGRGTMRVERAGRETLAARLADLIGATESHEQTVETQIESMANATVMPTAVMAGLGALRSGALGGLAGLWSNCIEVAWLTAPLTSLASTRAAARWGVLIKDGRSLELLPGIDTVVLDKTGTLTLDQLRVTAVHAAPGFDRPRLLTMAAAIERGQQHPVALAIVAAAEAEGVSIEAVDDDVRYAVGLGLQARLHGQALSLGSRRLVERNGVQLDPLAAAFADGAAARGHGVVFLASSEGVLGAFALAPVVRAEARRVVHAMKARGMAVEILTGDDPAPTRALATELGIERWRAGMLPEDKSRHVQALAGAGRRICFVGDGVNDALAMRHAHVSVSMAGASAIAVDSAQIILRDGSLERLDALFDLGRRHAQAGQRIAVAAGAPTIFAFGGVLFAGLGPAGTLAFYGAGLTTGLFVAANQNRWRPPTEQG